MLTWLYVPADRPDRVAKALDSDAGVVILDLEDAVAPGAKAGARDAALRVARTASRPIQIRINDPRTPYGREDLAALAELGGPAEIRLPKIEFAEEVRSVATGLPQARLHPLLESALGVERAFEIATASPAVGSIGLGEADLRADLGVADDAADTGLAWARSRVVVAARAAGLPPPAQSVYPDVRDLDGLAESCRAGRRLGFFGRAAIHPAQLPVIADAYRPSAAEVAAAEEIVGAADAAGPGAIALPDGRFVDVAVVRAARRTLEAAGVSR